MKIMNHAYRFDIVEKKEISINITKTIDIDKEMM